MDTRIAVGTPVTVKNMYGEHGNNDLVVLAHTSNPDGVGVGPKGNDPAKGHSFSAGWVYYPNSYVTPKEESKVNDFKAGDKVRYVNESNPSWHGVEGTIEGPGTTTNTRSVRLTIAPTGWAQGYSVGDLTNIGTYYLELVEEKPFTFKDIQVGDTIRRTQTYPSGATDVREGVVARQGSYFWAVDNFILAYDSDTHTENVTLELLNRPEPEPTLLEGTKAGDQLVLKLYNGATKVHTRNAKGQWTTLVFRNGEYSHTGFVWDTSDLEGEAQSAKSHKLLKL